MNHEIVYGAESDLDPSEYREVLERSGLAERHPVHDPQLMAEMLGASNLVLTARRRGDGGVA